MEALKERNRIEQGEYRATPQMNQTILAEGRRPSAHRAAEPRDHLECAGQSAGVPSGAAPLGWQRCRDGALDLRRTSVCRGLDQMNVLRSWALAQASALRVFTVVLSPRKR